jgi:hypothetical protein
MKCMQLWQARSVHQRVPRRTSSADRRPHTGPRQRTRERVHSLTPPPLNKLFEQEYLYRSVFAFPTGARAIGRVGARRFDAAGVSNAAPTGTGAFCKAMWDGIRAEPGEATMARLSRRAAPRHLGSTRRAPASSPPRLVRVRYPQRLPWSLAPIVPARLRRAPQACARRRPARLRGRRP